MQRILAHYRDNMTERPELIIIAHSQGTQVAIEVLNDPELAWLSNRFHSVKLVTMGSPFSNLYQHYFGHAYPALNSPYWATLRRRVDQWVNIFRIDDPVGTEIDFEPILRNSGHLNSNQRTRTQGSSDVVGGWLEETAPYAEASSCSDGECAVTQTPIQVSNHPVGCRGHVNYWTDREVLDIVHDIVLEPESQNRSTSKAA